MLRDEGHALRNMYQYQERDGEEDRKPGGKTRVKETWKGLKEEEDALDRTK